MKKLYVQSRFVGCGQYEYTLSRDEAGTNKVKDRQGNVRAWTTRDEAVAHAKKKLKKSVANAL